MTFALCILLMLLIGQIGALINYNLMVAIHLQEAENVVGSFGVAMNKGFALADTIIYLPLLMVGIIGFLFKRKWGVYSMLAAFGITAYWPIACIAILFFAKGAPNFYFENYVSYTIFLGLISVLAICGIIYMSQLAAKGDKNEN